MNVKVQELMTGSVVTTQPHKSIEHARKLMERNKIGALPIVDSEGRPVGIVSSTDLVPGPNDKSPISALMTEKVYTVAQYDDVSVAARIMRNHNIHRVVVTHEQKIVGVLSAFDLLQLIEGRRFVARPAPTPAKRRGGKRT